MPTYCLTEVATGKEIEVTMSVGEYVSRHVGEDVLIDGKKYQVDIGRQFGSSRHVTARWPIVSDSAAVFPHQIEQERAFLKARGVRCDYTPEGQPIFTDARHRRNVLKALNMVDRKSYI